jgi:hypothetical protein
MAAMVAGARQPEKPAKQQELLQPYRASDEAQQGGAP